MVLRRGHNEMVALTTSWIQRWMDVADRIPASY